MEILYEDEYLIAANKPPRVATVPGGEIPLHETVMGQLQKQYQKKGISPYPLHRLDRETSGVILFGKYPRDRELLEGIFGHPETHKKYLALLKGVPRPKNKEQKNKITIPLSARRQPRLGVKSEKVPAETNYKVLRSINLGGPLVCLVEAEIKTGRKHQIRQHFAKIGCPVVMDSLYGDREFNKQFRIRLRLGRLFLHAEKISFFHPFLKKQMAVEAPLPIDLETVLKKISR